jgi:AraC-like DNA-binding protein
MRPSAPPDAISAKMVLRVAEFCRKRGHDPEALCRSVGLTLEFLSGSDARVDYATAARLGTRALAITGDENFGLHLAQDVEDKGSFDAGLLLLMASPNVRTAFERMASYQRYWGDGNRAALHAAPGGLTVRYVLAGAEGDYARHSYECAMAEIALGARVLTGKPALPRVVRFRHSAPRDTSEHRGLFGCTLEFGAAHDEITFDDAVLEERLPHANAAFCTIFERQIEQALVRLPTVTSASAAVREVIRAALSSGSCTLAGTAKALSVSVRTLQRRLQIEGTSFAAVVDALRRELASVYLDRGIPVAEVASLLGYADDTAFHHAFRRWTGSSPARRRSVNA